MDLLGFALLNGVLYGALLFSLAAGLTLIYGLMGVINFAHASFFMVGAYLAYQVSGRWSFWGAILVVPPLLALLGAIIRRKLIARLVSGDQVNQLLLTFGIAMVTTELVQIIWGRLAVPYAIPEGMTQALFTLGGLDFSIYRFFVLAISLALFVVIAVVVTQTRIGMLLTAAQTQPQMVRALGYDLDRLYDWVFGAGAAVAGLAGVLGGNLLGVGPGMADQVSPLLFVIVVVGGLGSLTGALIIAFSIGFVDTLATTYKISLGPMIENTFGAITPGTLVDDLAKMNSANFAPMLPYLLMVAVLVFMPRGLYGKRDL